MARKPDFIRCNRCNYFHPPEFVGDCREGNNRFTIEQIDEFRDQQAARGSKRSIIVASIDLAKS